MKILKKRYIAIIIVIIVAIVFSFIGIKLSVTRQAEKVEEMFYTGVDGETGIQVYLDNAFNEAKVIHYTVIQYFDREYTDGLREAYNALVEAETLAEKYEYYNAILTEVESLIPLIETEYSMLDYDQLYLDTHIENLNNIQQMIDNSSYNEKVAEFEQDVLGIFPVNVLKGILDLEAPEYFS